MNPVFGGGKGKNLKKRSEIKKGGKTYGLLGQGTFIFVSYQIVRNRQISRKSI